jgi:hypothetical protein
MFLRYLAGRLPLTCGQRDGTQEQRGLQSSRTKGEIYHAQFEIDEKQSLARVPWRFR